MVWPDYESCAIYVTIWYGYAMSNTSATSIGCHDDNDRCQLGWSPTSHSTLTLPRYKTEFCSHTQPVYIPEPTTISALSKTYIHFVYIHSHLLSTCSHTPTLQTKHTSFSQSTIQSILPLSNCANFTNYTIPASSATPRIQFLPDLPDLVYHANEYLERLTMIGYCAESISRWLGIA